MSSANGSTVCWGRKLLLWGTTRLAKIVRITSSTDEVDHLSAKLRRIRWTCSWHRQHHALLVLRDKAIKPLLAAAQPLRPKRGAHNPKPIDLHYDAIQAAMKGVFHELGLAA